MEVVEVFDIDSFGRRAFMIVELATGHVLAALVTFAHVIVIDLLAPVVANRS